MQVEDCPSAVIDAATREIARLEARTQAQGFGLDGAEALRGQLRALRERKLAEASTGEKADLVAMLGGKVYPAEDLKSRRVTCN